LVVLINQANRGQPDLLIRAKGLCDGRSPSFQKNRVSIPRRRGSYRLGRRQLRIVPAGERRTT
jgi:hypothetical protein